MIPAEKQLTNKPCNFCHCRFLAWNRAAFCLVQEITYTRKYDACLHKSTCTRFLYNFHEQSVLAYSPAILCDVLQ